ncbi:transcriptional regulator [Streptomyces sp. SID13666]|uniref:transcriptional regulator n=1 Tax=unclassified Streptomyces TaxID=2593676 RepID=UPI0013BEC4BE|nr:MULTISPECIES: transcriptional regulator [unclassified Streptomyces]NEA58959.1 transcriptional regulator [Streptomyces sp. SID13666]NEA75305.1 transcriptional regulator [Streptomyces sp. SID13588]
MEPNTLFDAVLDEAGASHAGLAARINALGRARGMPLRYDRTAVTRWIKGQRPRGEVPDLIREVLGGLVQRPLTLADIGMDRGAVVQTAGTPLTGFVERATALWRADEQQRPHVRTAPVLTGPKAVMPLWEWENPPEDMDVSRTGVQRVTGADVAMLHAARAHYEELYRGAGGVATRDRVVGFLNAQAAPLLRGRYSDPLGRQLHRAVGALVGIAGICAYDTDAHGLAQRYFHQSLRLAKASGDRGLGACVVGMLVYQSLHLRDYRQAVAFAEAALRTAGHNVTPALAADLYAMQAKAYGRLGDRPSAHRCGRLAETAEQRIRTEDEPAETAYVQPGLVDVQLAEAFLSLGELRPALEHAVQAVSSPSHARGRVHRLAVLTHVELRRGEADHAATLAVRMVEQGRGMESQRLRDRFAAVRGHLAAYDSVLVVQAAGLIDELLRVPL